MTSIVWDTVTEESRQKAHELFELRDRKARRERIATAAMQGLLQQFSHKANETLARQAVGLADALIAELDKEKP